MHSTKTLLAAASLAVLTAAGLGSASAAPWDHHPAPVTRHQIRVDIRHDLRDLRRDEHRLVLDRQRIFASLRRHHVRWIGEPFILRGHAVVKVSGRFGRTTLIEINPRTGAILGTFRT
jgi:hypothetical protein